MSLPKTTQKADEEVEALDVNVPEDAQPIQPSISHHAANDQEPEHRNADGNAVPSEQKQIKRTTPRVAGDKVGIADNDDAGPWASSPLLRKGSEALCVTNETQARKSLRVYVSEDRMWYAAAGHAPDFNKVSRLDFVLLSIIAARRGDGILQTDLTKISGQDKRSTPKRTQALQDKGYIEKKKVQAKGVATSLCTLLKFVTPHVKRSSEIQDGNPEDDIWNGNEVTRKSPKGEVVDIRALLRDIFDALKEHNIISYIDLKRRLVGNSMLYWS